MDVVAHWNHWVVVVLMMTGFYVIMARSNLVKKILGLNVLQAAVILMYVTMGKVEGGTAAIYLEDPHAAHHGEAEHGDGHEDDEHHDDGGHHDAPQAHATRPVTYSNPVPHVLMLTAIVVGVATTALGLALVVRIHEAFGTIEEDDLLDLEEGGG
ncbi:MAG: cation:proton antiporter subunit C [Alphaproteobacteria bacterium]|nr:cation:proton antiporter subunit C [Alphaproteobacteria bacterium]